MGQANLYGKKTDGISVNGIVKEYIATGEVKNGDLVEFTTNNQVKKTTTSQFGGIALKSGTDELISVYTL